MTTNYNDVVRQGYVKMKSKNLGVWQRRWVILRRASSRGRRRLEKYPDEVHARRTYLHKMIELTDVRQVVRLPADVRKYGVAVCFQDHSSRLFSCDSDCEADEWLSAVRDLCLGKPGAITQDEPDLLHTGWQREITERYHVYVEASPRLPLHGEALLQVTARHLTVWDVTNPTLRLLAWPLDSLRRYGHTNNMFTFEAASTGETEAGLFVLSTMDGQSIYREVHQAALSIACDQFIINHTINQSRNQTTNQSMSQTTNQSINHTINQSTNASSERSRNNLSKNQQCRTEFSPHRKGGNLNEVSRERKGTRRPPSGQTPDLHLSRSSYVQYLTARDTHTASTDLPVREITIDAVDVLNSNAAPDNLPRTLGSVWRTAESPHRSSSHSSTLYTSTPPATPGHAAPGSEPRSRHPNTPASRDHHAHAADLRYSSPGQTNSSQTKLSSQMLATPQHRNRRHQRV